MHRCQTLVPCTLPIHKLLHIYDNIRFFGPAWTMYMDFTSIVSFSPVFADYYPVVHRRSTDMECFRS